MKKVGNRYEFKVGDITYLTPEIPPLETIDGYYLPKKEQKWKRIPFPSDEQYELMSPHDQEKVLVDDISRRLYGYWFYVNGVPTHVTGDYYHFINNWYMAADTKDGYPEYRASDRMRYYHWDFCENDPGCVGEMYLCQKRQGKALDITTPIPTPNGWRTMEDIQVGDFVFGSDGKPTKVIGATGVQYNRKCYKITFSDKTELIADEDHKWLVWDKRTREALCGGFKTAIPRVVTTKEMTLKMRTNSTNSPANNWSIENCKAIEYPKKKLLIPPYIMGIWLGDGNSRLPKLTSVDREIIDAWEGYGKSIGVRMISYPSEPLTYALSNPNGTQKPGSNPLVTHLTNYNLWKNKHIPEDYLQSSIEDRIELFKGLMDTDGCNVKGSSCFEYCSKSEKLIYGVKELAESLGYKTTVSIKFNKKYNKSYYYLRFGGYAAEVFKLQRKRDGRSMIRTGGIRTNHRYVTSIVPIDSVPVKCIEVDNADHSYLCGKNFIVTHNSEGAMCMVYNKVSIYDNKHGALQSLTGPTAKTNLFDRIIRSWERMPYYQKPLDEGIYPPKKALRFFPPSKKTSKSKRLVNKKAINSWIDYLPTVSTALQGKKPFRVLLDEPGTVQEMDLMDWFTTTRQQCILGPKVVGKILLPTTIETLASRGAASFIELWNKSDYKNRDANGHTQSRLYRYFKPSYLGLEGFIDEYGNDMLDENGEYMAKIYLQNMFDAASPEDRIKLKRQYPFTVEDAFDMVASDIWEEDVKAILREVRKGLLINEPPILHCKPYKFGEEIRFEESSKSGKNVVKIYEKAKPNVIYKGGYDGSASDKQTGSEDGSKTAFVVLKGFEGMGAENYVPVCTFSVRPDKMEDAYQTILLLSEHYGQYGMFELLGESNAGQASPVVAYFGNRGGLKYIMKKPKTLGFNYNDKTDKFWIYRNEHVKDLQKRLANMFLRRYGHNLKHLDLVDDLIEMGKRNTDEADAFLMCVLALGDFDKTLDAKKKIQKLTRQVRVMKTGAGGYKYWDWIEVPINQ